MRNPDVFPDPDRFDPDRFRRKQEAALPPGSYVPHGDGQSTHHRCPGETIVTVAVKVYLTLLLREGGVDDPRAGPHADQRAVPPAGERTRRVNFRAACRRRRLTPGRRHTAGEARHPEADDLTRLMIFGDRQPVTRTPKDIGLDYEDAAFPATDGVSLNGWFVPAGDAKAPAVVFVHGWLWNRGGNAAGRVPFVDRDVDFLPATKALHDAGFHVLLFDLSNHGESGKRPPLTMGRWEARDFIGAVHYLRSRADVDSATHRRPRALRPGANTVMYAIPDGPPIKALLAVQPTRLPVFNRNFARQVLGPLGPVAARSTDLVYLILRAPLPSRHDPAFPLAIWATTVVQYVQGTGDPWGEMGIVEEFSALTPRSLGVIRYPSTGRYEGYQYVSREAADVAGFFTAQL